MVLLGVRAGCEVDRCPTRRFFTMPGNLVSRTEWFGFGGADVGVVAGGCSAVFVGGRGLMSEWNVVGLLSFLTLARGHWQAHEQLRAVLKMLLGDLPSDLPVLFLGTASVCGKDVDEEIRTLFGHNW